MKAVDLNLSALKIKGNLSPSQANFGDWSDKLTFIN